MSRVDSTIATACKPGPRLLFEPIEIGADDGAAGFNAPVNFFNHFMHPHMPLHRLCRQDQPRLRGEGAGHMSGAVCTTAAAQALAVNGHLMPGQFGQSRANPIAERLGEGIAVDASDDVA